MTPETVFPLANVLALVGWLLLAILPHRRQIIDVVAGRAIPLAFALAYVAIVAATWGNSAGGFSSLQGVRQLFENPWLLLAGWLHYLAFDLLIGVWEVRDAREQGISHLAVVPCLALTFLFAPAGWLLYLGVRAARKRSPG